MTEIVIKELPFTVSVLTEAGTQEFDETVLLTITSSLELGNDTAGVLPPPVNQLFRSVFQLELPPPPPTSK